LTRGKCPAVQAAIRVEALAFAKAAGVSFPTCLVGRGGWSGVRGVRGGELGLGAGGRGGADEEAGGGISQQDFVQEFVQEWACFWTAWAGVESAA